LKKKLKILINNAIINKRSENNLRKKNKHDNQKLQKSQRV